jgi:GT2 family glycosyltransferase
MTERGAERVEGLVTFTLTACGRPDLLERTIDSFVAMNTYPIAHYIIIEDSGVVGINDDLKKKYEKLNIEWIENKSRIGQIASIDIMYEKVKSEYIFHCEDDWLFTAPGFIEKSLEIMESNPKWLQVWLRDQNDTNYHPVEAYSEDYDLMELNDKDEWHGFTFNPGLRRVADYKLCGCYKNIGHEGQLSIFYKELGFRAPIVKEKYIEHIGWHRHIPRFESK